MAYRIFLIFAYLENGLEKFLIFFLSGEWLIEFSYFLPIWRMAYRIFLFFAYLENGL